MHGNSVKTEKMFIKTKHFNDNYLSLRNSSVHNEKNQQIGSYLSDNELKIFGNIYGFGHKTNGSNRQRIQAETAIARTCCDNQQ